MTKAASGLGIPSSRSVDSAESGGVSESSSMVDEVSEYCPKLTYQQVSFGGALWFFHSSWKFLFSVEVEEDE